MTGQNLDSRTFCMVTKLTTRSFMINLPIFLQKIRKRKSKKLKPKVSFHMLILYKHTSSMLSNNLWSLFPFKGKTQLTGQFVCCILASRYFDPCPSPIKRVQCVAIVSSKLSENMIDWIDQTAHAWTTRCTFNSPNLPPNVLINFNLRQRIN